MPDEMRTGFVLSPTSLDGTTTLVYSRQAVQIDDESGAATISSTAVLSASDADEILSREKPAQKVIDLDPLRLTLRPTERPGTVEVTGTPLAVPERWPAAAAADRVMTLITRSRLHNEQGRPRLHGAALADSNGRSILLLGESGAGKSTLCACLAAAGLELITDEQLTVFADQGLVGSFTRPVSIKRPGLAHLPEGIVPDGADTDQVRLLITAAQLGTRHRLTGRPALIVLPQRSDDYEGPPTWSQLDPARAIEALCANNLDLARKPALALDGFAWLAATVPMVRLRYRDAVDAVAPVLGLLGDPPDAADARRSVQVAGTPKHGNSPTAVDGVYVAAGVVTANVGDEAVLFEPTGRGVVRLNADGAGLWATLPWDHVPWTNRSVGADLSGVFEVVTTLVDRGFLKLAGRPETRFARAPGLVSRCLRDTEIVTRPDYRVARLEGAAAVVWRALAEPGRPDEITRRILADEPGHPPERDASVAHGHPDPVAMAQQVDAALEMLIDGDLVVALSEPPSPGIDPVPSHQ